MSTTQCPIQLTRRILSDTASSGAAQSPGPWRVLRELDGLLGEIASGRGRAEHCEALESVAKAIEIADGAGAELRKSLSVLLTQDRDILLSHIEARYCPSGECENLVGAPCQIACPANVDVPTYVALVGAGRYKEALQVLLRDLPIPGSLARVCVHPCEKACRRGEVDAPIAICQLKRVAFDRAYEQGFQPPKPSPGLFEEKIAVIGSGPAGLSAAYFLSKKGYRPTIFEAMPEPGGLLRWGIPAYRLPRHILKMEIDHIRDLGVEIRTHTPLGRELTLAKLKEQGYQAVFLGIGAWAPVPLAVRGADESSHVIDSLAFLSRPELQKAAAGKRVVVVGGGNAAMDCLRTALRSQVKSAHLIYRRSRREMPAHLEEVEAAEREGAMMTYLCSPVRVVSDGGALTGIECIRNELSEPDASGRRRPVPVQDSEHFTPADVIISAIGQQVDRPALDGAGDVEFTKYRLIQVDPVTLETSMPGVFAGGDAITGPATVVEAVAAGRKAAESIHCLLRGLPMPRHPSLPRRPDDAPVLPVSAVEKSKTTRPEPVEIELPRRIGGFDEVSAVLGEAAASGEARRCLRCDICIGCGRCVEVCRDELGIEAIHLSYVTAGGTEDTDFLRPAERCIGCGACAVNCPTNALTLEDRGGERRIAMCGGEMSRHVLVPCVSCGEPFIAARHLEYLRGNIEDHPKTKRSPSLCAFCARKAWAENAIGAVPN
jgi:putative selenate reductase YgfK subunit